MLIVLQDFEFTAAFLNLGQESACTEGGNSISETNKKKLCINFGAH
jgi:hypothetical protein